MSENRTGEKTFEIALGELEAIVRQLQEGNMPLEEAINAYKKGIELSQFCTKTLNEAEETVTKVMNDRGEIENFKREDTC